MVLPFQSIEQLDEPRAEGKEQLGLFAVNAGGRQSGGWTNRLIWGDNKLVLSSLKNGPLRREIDAAGGLKLIYIDPPFDVGADFSVDIEVGDGESVTKEPSVIEELAYRDTWGRGTDSYLSMIYERLRLMRDLLAEDGSIYVHVGPNVGGFVEILIREIFGGSLTTPISWKRVTAHSDSQRWGVFHDLVIWGTKSSGFTWNPRFEPYAQSCIDAKYTSRMPDGRRYTLGDLSSPNPRPNMTYEWRGHKPPPMGWRYELGTMERLYAEGRIELAKKEGGRPRYRHFLDEMFGVPLGTV